MATVSMPCAAALGGDALIDSLEALPGLLTPARLMPAA
jgi:hypothetical protein